MQTIFDATRYSQKPTPETWGAKAIQMVYGNDRALNWNPDSHDGRLVCLDVEHLPVDIRKHSDAEVEASCDRMRVTADRLHHKFPGMRLGYYGEMPIRDYWSTIRKDTTKHDRWVSWTSANARLRKPRDGQWPYDTRSLADVVDVIFPSVYAFYDRPDEWVQYAEENIREAQKFQKTVYAFVWPAYHSSNPELRSQYIGNDYFRRQLELCLRLADGVVIWGSTGDTSNPPWELAENTWLPVVKEFI